MEQQKPVNMGRSQEDETLSDRIEGNRIILSGKGKFPKSVLINLGFCWKEYRLIKTESNGFILTK